MIAIVSCFYSLWKLKAPGKLFSCVSFTQTHLSEIIDTLTFHWNHLYEVFKTLSDCHYLFDFYTLFIWLNTLFIWLTNLIDLIYMCINFELTIFFVCLKKKIQDGRLKKTELFNYPQKLSNCRQNFTDWSLG